LIFEEQHIIFPPLKILVKNGEWRMAGIVEMEIWKLGWRNQQKGIT
jgi:hypothetical protein